MGYIKQYNRIQYIFLLSLSYQIAERPGSPSAHKAALMDRDECWAFISSWSQEISRDVYKWILLIFSPVSALVQIFCSVSIQSSGWFPWAKNFSLSQGLGLLPDTIIASFFLKIRGAVLPFPVQNDQRVPHWENKPKETTEVWRH